MPGILAATPCVAGAAVLVTFVLKRLQSRRRRNNRTHDEIAVTDIQSLRSLQGLHQIQQVLQSGVAASHACCVESVEAHTPDLAYIPPLLTALTRLTSLDLSGCAITYIPFSISSLTSLQNLSVSRNKLRVLPFELGSLTALKKIDVSGNAIISLPKELCGLTGLEMCNVLGNKLKSLPEGIGSMVNLRLLGLKSNQLERLPSSFSKLTSLVELFLTDNCLQAFPPGFGQLVSLVKLQASFNAFESIPEELAQLPRLEMMRVAVCNISTLPSSITDASGGSRGSGGARPLPPWSSLSWFSLGGNPASDIPLPSRQELLHCSMDELELHGKLGDGASGEVLKASWSGGLWAVKVFRADVSPDGRTQEEVAIACAVDHPHLTKVHATIKSGAGAGAIKKGGGAEAVVKTGAGGGGGGGAEDAVPASTTDALSAPATNDTSAPATDATSAPATDATSAPATDALSAPATDATSAPATDATSAPATDATSAPGSVSALVMHICSGSPLALKPTSAHLLRCKWDPTATMSFGFALKVAQGVASALAYLHSLCICHGDVYAHNILVDDKGHATLCDFGASFCYGQPQRPFWEAMEVRAFGLFLQDLSKQVSMECPGRLLPEEGPPGARDLTGGMLQLLGQRCTAADPAARPKFAELEEALQRA